MTISASMPVLTNYTNSPSPATPEPPVHIKYKRPDSDALTPSSRPSPEVALGHKSYVNSEVLFQDKHVKISQEVEFSAAQNGDVGTIFSQIVLETGNRADRVNITRTSDGKLLATVNDKAYTLELLNRPELGMVQPLYIKTHGGNDCVVVAPDVTTPIRIDLGDGDDYARGGGGTTQIKGGAGDDFIEMGKGRGVASGGEGNDTLVAGSGSSALYGGNGNDRLQALEGPVGRIVHMDGGRGHDFMIAKNGHTVMHGGGGDNLMVSLGSSVIYTGRGHNNVRSHHDNTVIYAKPSDNVIRSLSSRRFDVTPSDAGKTAYLVEGSAEFRQRVEDDLELLRMSPIGQQSLKKEDELAARNNAPVSLRELDTRDDMTYGFNTQAIQRYLQAGGDVESLTDSQLGYIVEGEPGETADLGTINYNPMYMYDDRSPPITSLAHERGHAFAGATGQNLKGETATPDTHQEREPNIERQAIGLQTAVPPVDFDGDPSTAKTTTNPREFTENGLKEEMGLPLRKRVYTTKRA
ncbi:M91 family zinc metallopeptidase [Pseudomonas marginalis]|uniref:M91 family zinc metallopeptidase n=1 Tax=Pseudomonas marginalis TaxID=298 RepID=UPI002B1CD82B|nr:M91 family zinc metallopeptidase [Pseudomonas marginalis]